MNWNYDANGKRYDTRVKGEGGKGNNVIYWQGGGGGNNNNSHQLNLGSQLEAERNKSQELQLACGVAAAPPGLCHCVDQRLCADARLTVDEDDDDDDDVVVLVVLVVLVDVELLDDVDDVRQPSPARP